MSKEFDALNALNALFEAEDVHHEGDPNCDCSTCYRERQRQAVKEFRERNAFRFDHEGVTHLNSTLDRAQREQAKLGIIAPIFDIRTTPPTLVTEES